MLLAILLTILTSWMVRRQRPLKVDRWFRRLQLLSATAETAAAVHALATPEKALKHCIEINRYENESDRLCRTLIAQLFDEEKDPVQIIKWKEIFEVIETAVDKCEDVANVIEGVILKSA